MALWLNSDQKNLSQLLPATCYRTVQDINSKRINSVFHGCSFFGTWERQRIILLKFCWQKGLSRRSHSYERDWGLFSVPFCYALLGGGGHFWRIVWLCFGVCLSPTPSRQPLFETSELRLFTGAFLDYYQILTLPFAKCFSGFALVPHQVPPLSPSQGHTCHTVGNLWKARLRIPWA